jgi:hypothetical protein
MNEQGARDRREQAAWARGVRACSPSSFSSTAAEATLVRPLSCVVSERWLMWAPRQARSVTCSLCSSSSRINGPSSAVRTGAIAQCPYPGGPPRLVWGTGLVLAIL